MAFNGKIKTDLWSRWVTEIDARCHEGIDAEPL